MELRKSAEDYLEAMLMMQEAHGYIRSVDVAVQLGVTKPSVSYAAKRLRESGYITMDVNGLISLTPAGLEIASSIYARHKLFTSILVKLGVPEAIARDDACKLEHDISPEGFEAVRRYAEAKGIH